LIDKHGQQGGTMRKWHTDLVRMEEMGEEHILAIAAQGMRLSEALASLGVNARAFNAWAEAKPHRRLAWYNARPWTQQGEQHGRTEEEAR